MKEKDKLKNGNSLETQFWSENVKIDKNSPLYKEIDELWNSKNDYYIDMDKFNKEMKDYHSTKNKKGT